MTNNHDFTDTFKLFADAGAAGVGLLTWLSVSVIPVVIQWATVIWVLLRLYEMPTVQRWLRRKPRQ